MVLRYETECAKQGVMVQPVEERIKKEMEKANQERLEDKCCIKKQMGK